MAFIDEDGVRFRPVPVVNTPPPPAPPPTIMNMQQLNALEAQYNQPISQPGTVTTFAPNTSVNMPPPPAPPPAPAPVADTAAAAPATSPMGQNATPNYNVPDPFSTAQQQYIPPPPPAPAPAPAPVAAPAPAPTAANDYAGLDPAIRNAILNQPTAPPPPAPPPAVPSAPAPPTAPGSGITPEQAAALGIDPAIYAAMNSPQGLAAATLPGTNIPAHPELQPQPTPAPPSSGAGLTREQLTAMGVDPAIANAVLANQANQGTTPPPVDPSSPAVQNTPPDPNAVGTGTANDPNVMFSEDPVYLASQAEAKLARKTAAGNYLESLKSMLLQFGDVNLAHQILDGIGSQVDQYLGQSQDLASYFAQFNGIDNPDTSFSQMAQYNRMVREGMKNATEAINNQGLYYSGAGAKSLAEFQYQNQLKLSQMLSATRAAVAQAGQDFFGRLQGAQSSEIAAMNDAYNRLVQKALGGDFSLGNFESPTTGGTPGIPAAGTGSSKPPKPPKPPLKSKPKVKVRPKVYVQANPTQRPKPKAPIRPPVQANPTQRRRK